MTITVPKSTAKILMRLTGDPRPDAALLLVLQDAVTHRLEGIEAKLKVFERKYEMTFEEYKQRWETEDRDEDYTYEAEMDYLEWEALVTRKEKLEAVTGLLL